MTKYVQALQTDAEEMADLRVAAMRQSLEALGRFDPVRARNRLLDGFDPTCTFKIERDGQMVGFFVLKQHADHLHLDHLYVRQSEQGNGIGGKVITHVKITAQAQNLPVRLCALKNSKANEFYAAMGFEITRHEPFDTHYQYTPIVNAG